MSESRTDGRAPSRIETACVHGSYDPSEHHQAVSMPIYQASAYSYDSVDGAAALFSGELEGNIYSRLGTPTTDEAERRVARLEGGIGAVSFASGMAALSGFILNFLKSGDAVACSFSVYGGTAGLLSDTLPRLGIEAAFFDPLRAESLRAVMTDRVRLIIAENLANPALSVPDHEGIASIAREWRVPYLVDNTLATPIVSRPLSYGADFVLHSTTKYMTGHGDAIGGMIVDGGSFHFDRARYPAMFDPAPNGKPYVEAFGREVFLTRLRMKTLMNLGGCMAPFNAWLLLRGIESLHVRYPRHLENAAYLAGKLATHPLVAWVNHPSLPAHPSRENARRYLDGTFGAMIGFAPKGGFDAARAFIDRVKLVTHTTNIGDAKTLVIHPASTTHRNMSARQREAAGIGDDFIRMSVGIEHAEDIYESIDEALRYGSV